jgi:hypothetical protein
VGTTFIHYFRHMIKEKLVLALCLFSIFTLTALGSQISPTPCSDSVPTAAFKYSIVMLTCGGCGSGYNVFSDSSTSVPGNPIVGWSWEFPGASPSYSNIQHPPINITYPVPGDYTVCLTVTSLNGCKDSICKLVHIVVTSVNEIQRGSSISIYPNPTSGVFQILMAENFSHRIEIYNLLGDQLTNASEDQRVSASSEQIDLRSQPKGIYFLKIITQNGVEVKKVVKE